MLSTVQCLKHGIYYVSGTHGIAKNNKFCNDDGESGDYGRQDAEIKEIQKHYLLSS